MKQYNHFFLLFVVGSCSARVSIQAVVKVPVAEACHQSVRPLCKNITACYRSFPIAPDKGYAGFLRLHQFLYNQVVTIIKQLPTGEVLVEVPSLFYQDRLSNKKRNDFWMLKKDLILLSSLKKEFQNYLPSSIDYKKPLSQYSSAVLTLTKPWYNKKQNERIQQELVLYDVQKMIQRYHTLFGLSIIQTKKPVVCTFLVAMQPLPITKLLNVHGGYLCLFFVVGQIKKSVLFLMSLEDVVLLHQFKIKALNE